MQENYQSFSVSTDLEFIDKSKAGIEKKLQLMLAS